MSVSLLRDFDLQPVHTFGLQSRAAVCASISRPGQVLTAVDAAGSVPALVLGGGSNIIPSPEVSGLVLLNQTAGIQLRSSADGSTVELTAAAGVQWHDLVLWSLAQGLGGLENMALIPGTVGAAPMQNIGAYGVELKDVFLRLRALDYRSGEVVVFETADCRFGYRDSIFKREAANTYFILDVSLRLYAKGHVPSVAYGDIQQELRLAGIDLPTAEQVAQAVMRIRQRKLPDWRILGNAGSFFKNPIVTADVAQALRNRYPQVPAYPQSDGYVKLAAGWLIEQCGWKGRREGAVGCYEKQALVLVNYGGASSIDLLRFSGRIQESVMDTFGLALEREVNVV
jgi:UDP-N-acetylmuramate dehydrogenase